jgi:hypothetical protein
LRHILRRIVVAAATVASFALVAANVGSAGRAQQTFNCDGLGDITFTVTTTNNEHSVAWGVGTISGGTHLIPTSFNFSAVDLTTGETLFSDSQTKGNGQGQHNQPTITCTSPPETATAGELGIPGVDPTDVVEFSFSATVVYKG